jgi:uncharacterized protein (TIGR03086 family)
MNPTDLRDLHRRVLRASVEVVSMATAADLDRATPCAAWTLRDLLAHMTVQHYGFAAAAVGQGADLAMWTIRPLGDTAVSAYIEAVAIVLAAFAADGVLAQPFSLPEITTLRTFPGSQAIGFHLIDYVVHGWDVARSLGVGFALDADVLEAAWQITLAVPDGEQRLAPGAAFRPSIAAPASAAPLDRIVAALGRSPNWPDNDEIS